ncbi:MAG: hypothetical protein QG646_4338 [Euryarchaeota archaeon]|jgi:hypothetical protein|nr:hypothetical protein [Euryarchaeota archaeon]
METETETVSIKELPIEIKELLKNTDFPVEKKDIIEQEWKRGAIPDIVRELGMLPDKKYNNAEDVAKELHRLYIGAST